MCVCVRDCICLWSGERGVGMRVCVFEAVVCGIVILLEKDKLAYTHVYVLSISICVCVSRGGGS